MTLLTAMINTNSTYFFLAKVCLETDHVGDGYCDDIANTQICNWDGGDCCGPYANTDHCSDCTCQDPNLTTQMSTTGPVSSTGPVSTTGPISTTVTTSNPTTGSIGKANIF